MNIFAKTIEHRQHRYQTCGDYWHGYREHERSMEIRVSAMNPVSELAIIVHELVEFFLCQRAGIKEADITAFDIQWEAVKANGRNEKYDEPGADPRAPYYHQHAIATKIERIIVRAGGLTWRSHCKTVDSLPYGTEEGKKS